MANRREKRAAASPKGMSHAERVELEKLRAEKRAKEIPAMGPNGQCCRHCPLWHVRTDVDPVTKKAAEDRATLTQSTCMLDPGTPVYVPGPMNSPGEVFTHPRTMRAFGWCSHYAGTPVPDVNAEAA